MKQQSDKARKEYDEAAKTISQLFNVTDRYVRRVVADTTFKIYKGEKPMAIRRAYVKYLQGKQSLLKKIAPLAKAA